VRDVIVEASRERRSLAKQLRRLAGADHLHLVTPEAMREKLEQHGLPPDRFGVGEALEVAASGDVPVLLDLLDHLVALSSGAPIMLVCLTRPELLESRPGWNAPQPNRALIMLDALADEDARELADGLGAKELARVLVEGNPLFVEQLVAVDTGGDTGELPASIQAVLAARIDRLEDGERMLLQRAAVEGRTFHAAALVVSPGGGTEESGSPRAIENRLVALTRKGLIGPDQPEFPGEDAFRFTHALIREAAYATLPKRDRARLHAQIAGWLERHPQAADEIVGFHLEQACRLGMVLGPAGAHERGLARRAAARFETASHGAIARGRPDAACALLERAVALLGNGEPARGALLPALGAALYQAGRMSDATSVLDEAIAVAPDPRTQARARVEREFVRLETQTDVGSDQPRAVTESVVSLLADDEEGLCRLWSLRAQIAYIAGRTNQADAAWSRAAEHAERAANERQLFEVLAWRAASAVFGATPVADAIERCRDFRTRVAVSPVAVAWTINPAAVLHAMNGEFALANQLLQEAAAILSELGGLYASVSHLEASVRLLAGQPELAEAALRADVETLAEMNGAGSLATTTAMLAQAVYDQGRLDEADDLCASAAEVTAADDIFTQVIWRGVRGSILARRGAHDEAEALAREAVALVAPTDLLSQHGDAMLRLADVLRVNPLSPAGAASRAVHSAVDLYERKGNVAAAARARSLLDTRSSEV